MGNMKSIEKAIEAMPPAELAEFRRWFAEFSGSGSGTHAEYDKFVG